MNHVTATLYHDHVIISNNNIGQDGGRVVSGRRHFGGDDG